MQICRIELFRSTEYSGSDQVVSVECYTRESLTNSSRAGICRYWTSTVRYQNDIDRPSVILDTCIVMVSTTYKVAGCWSCFISMCHPAESVPIKGRSPWQGLYIDDGWS